MSCHVFLVLFMYFKRNFLNGNILQCIARYNYRFMKLKPSPVGLMDQKKLIDILISVMFPRPGSVSIFSSIHLLVFFLYLFKWIFIIVSATELLELVFVLLAVQTSRQCDILQMEWIGD